MQNSPSEETRSIIDGVNAAENLERAIVAALDEYCQAIKKRDLNDREIAQAMRGLSDVLRTIDRS